MSNITTASDRFTQENDYLWRLTRDIIFYAGLPCMIIGILGNLLNLIVFSGEKFQKLPIGFYLSCLSLSDILQVYLVLGFYFQKYDISLENTSRFMCKLHNYLYATLPLFSAWILVIISIDRLISVKFLCAIKWTNQKKYQKIALLVTLAIICLPNLPCFTFYDLQTNNNDTLLYCGVAKENYALSQRFLFYNCMISITLVPFTIMTLCTCYTIATLIASKKRMSTGKEMKKERRFSATLTALNIIFFIFYLPVCLAMVINDRAYSISVNANKDLYDLAYTIFYLAVYMRHAHSCLQFFIYLAVNKTFRHEFLRLFGTIVGVNLSTTSSIKALKSSSQNKTNQQSEKSFAKI